MSKFVIGGFEIKWSRREPNYLQRAAYMDEALDGLIVMSGPPL